MNWLVCWVLWDNLISWKLSVPVSGYNAAPQIKCGAALVCASYSGALFAIFLHVNLN